MHKLITHFLCAIPLLLTSIDLQSQQACGFDHIHQQMLEDSTFQNQQEVISKKINQQIKSNKSSDKSNAVYTIPVVVHIVYGNKNAAHNISDAQVKSGIQRLNEIFSNQDGSSTDTKIQFKLASRTPECGSTNGIIHVDGSGLQDYATEGIDMEATDTDGKGASRLGLFNLSRWNPEEYLNIWVVNEISDNNGGAGVQAFATFPGTHFLYDGVVVLFNAFGYDYNNCNCFELKSYTDENKIIAHEIGHYFSLYHTFEGDNGGLSCPPTDITKGDQIADTPAHIRTFNCLSSANNCYPANGPFSSMDAVVHNYMGYSTESCQHEFSQGQADRMRAALETSRSKLLTSHGCVPISISQPAASCTPQSVQGVTGEYGMGIISVNIGNLSSGSGSTYQDGGYIDNWCQNAGFEANTEYAINIENYGYYNEDVRVYIDYNGNGSFEADESIFNSFNKSIHTGNFTTPTTPLFDKPLRLRVISDHYQYNINGGCYAPTYGQVEDYSVLFATPAEEVIIDRGLSLAFDGADDYLQTNFSPDPLDESFTYEFWCKPEGNKSQGQVIFDKMPDNFSTYNFMMLWHGRLFVYMNRSLLFMNADPIKYGQWHHIAYTWDGAVQRLYLNGKLVGSDPVEIIKSNTAKLNFGAFFKNHLFFKGQIDELRTWNNVRTGEQIRANMHLTKEIISEEGLTYYHFNDGPENNMIYDFSKNNPATIFGNPAMQESSVNIGFSGVQKAISNITIGQTINEPEVGLSLNFSEADTALAFAVTMQEYEPSSYVGMDGLTIFSQKMWTINPSFNGTFNSTITFDFASPIFTNMDPSGYRLYQRSIGSDGEWTILVGSASDISGATITFNGINKSGQFIIAK